MNKREHHGCWKRLAFDAERSDYLALLYRIPLIFFCTNFCLVFLTDKSPSFGLSFSLLSFAVKEKSYSEVLKFQNDQREYVRGCESERERASSERFYCIDFL